MRRGATFIQLANNGLIINPSNGLVKILGGFLILNFLITKDILWISENISIYIQLNNNVAQMDF